MNTDWNDLIQHYIAEQTSEEETRRLEAALKVDDALADLYLRHTELDVALEAEAASAEVMRELLTVPMVSWTRRGGHWLSWRPLTAAAAGIVFGMFCTSVVWAYAGNGRSWSLLRESFEGDGFRWQSGFPKQMGQWGGDEAKVVSIEAGVNPKDGARMLKLDPVKTDLSSRTHCIVDLQNQQKAFGSTTRQIELREEGQRSQALRRRRPRRTDGRPLGEGARAPVRRADQDQARQ